LFSVLMCVFLFFGFYILSLNHKDRLNQIFLIINFCFAFVCVCAFFTQIKMLEKSIQSWYKYGLIFYHLSWYLVLIFCVTLTRLLKQVWYIYLILAIPIVFLIAEVFIKLNNSIYHHDKAGIRYVSHYYGNVSAILNHINLITFFYLIFSIIILLIAFNRSVLRKFKLQIKIIIITLILSIVLAFIDHVVLFYWLGILTSRIPGFVVIYSLFWVVGIWYAMIRYRFMAVTPAMISRDILSNIDEHIILLDTDMKIISFNLNNPEHHNNYLNHHISVIVDNYDSISEEIEKLKVGKQNDFVCRLNFEIGNDGSNSMDVKFKNIRDKFHDLIGILLIAKEVKELKQLKSIYRITDREANVIQSVLSGKTNHEIADDLSITERTVKAHLTNIFNKLGVDNKMQLVMLLKEFNLIPEKQADKVLFGKQKKMVPDLKLF
jgi:DNA-binding CsgD family transcriptional regulator